MQVQRSAGAAAAPGSPQQGRNRPFSSCRYGLRPGLEGCWLGRLNSFQRPTAGTACPEIDSNSKLNSQLKVEISISLTYRIFINFLRKNLIETAFLSLSIKKDLVLGLLCGKLFPCHKASIAEWISKEGKLWRVLLSLLSTEIKKGLISICLQLKNLSK